MDEKKTSQCRICMSFCGIEATVHDGRVVKIEPDRQNPYNWRDFCVAGARADMVLYHPHRITRPMKRVGSRYVEASYDEALDDIAARIQALRAASGPDAVGAYLGNPFAFNTYAVMMALSLLTGLRTENLYYFGSVDENNLHVVSEAMYGSPTFFLVPDLDDCDCLLLIGANPAVSGMGWVGANPDGWKRYVKRSQEQGADLIVVDPVLSPSAAQARTHIAVRPGSDWALLLGVLQVTLKNGWTDAAALAIAHGAEHLQPLADLVSLDQLSRLCGVPVATIEDIARRFATARTAVCLTRTGVAQNENGTLGEWLGHVLNFVTGRLDRPGGHLCTYGVLPIAGVEGDMFGRRTGPSRVRGWPTVMGYRSVAELPEEIETPGPGQLRAMFLASGNPVVSGPQGMQLDTALAKLDLLVAVDLVQRESHRHAHWLIPGEHFLERDEFNPGASGTAERPFALYARAVVDRPPGVWPEWMFWKGLADRLGIALLGGLASTPGFHPESAVRAAVAQAGRLRWDDLMNAPHGLFFADKPYGQVPEVLKTADQKVHVAPQAFTDRLRIVLARSLAAEAATAGAARDADFPFSLVSRRKRNMMNSWLAETTGQMSSDFTGDIAEMNREDAHALGIVDGAPIAIESRVGRVVARARVSDRPAPGVVIMEHGWGSRVFDPTRGVAVALHGLNRNALVPNDVTDPLSGTCNLNGAHVRVRRAA